MVEIVNRQKTSRIDRKRLERTLRALVRRYGLQKAEVGLAFVGDRKIRTLNRTFRKKDKATDVLSFPLRERAADGKYYLGDIVISVPQARRQAFRLGHSLSDELVDLTVHGFLHLLGYEHSCGHEEEETKIHEQILGS
jgi:probable rRNA maturation factor